MKGFGEKIVVGDRVGVVVKGVQKRTYIHYEILFEDAEQSASDWHDQVRVTEILREDDIEA